MHRRGSVRGRKARRNTSGPGTVLRVTSLTAFSLREVLVLAGGGLALGIPIALGTTKFVASLLYQVKPSDPGVLAAAVGINLGAALVAGYLPDFRASRIDPVATVRHK